MVILSVSTLCLASLHKTIHFFAGQPNTHCSVMQVLQCLHSIGVLLQEGKGSLPG